MRYRLSTLMILLAIGPPLLATAWTNRKLLNEPWRPPAVYIPPNANPTVAAFVRERAAWRHMLHYLAGAGAVICYPVAVILLASVLRTMRHWWQPPKITPTARAAIAAATLSASFGLAFFLTFPPPWGYASWGEYFAAPRQQQSQTVGRP